MRWDYKSRYCEHKIVSELLPKKSSSPKRLSFTYPWYHQIFLHLLILIISLHHSCSIRKRHNGSTNHYNINTQNNIDTPIIQQQTVPRSQQASSCCNNNNNNSNSNTFLVVTVPLATTARDSVDNCENHWNHKNNCTLSDMLHVGTIGIQSQKMFRERKKKTSIPGTSKETIDEPVW